MNKIVISLSIFCLIVNFSFTDLRSEIKNIIIAKAGNILITSIDVENEILTNLLLNNQNRTQENIDIRKNLALKSLINSSIKKNEVNKYEVNSYNKKDLERYTKSIAKKFATDVRGLKEIFYKNNIDYNTFVVKHEIELRWNTLIYSIYKDQININIFDVENEVAEVLRTDDFIEYNLSEITIPQSQYSKDKLEEIMKSIKNNGFEETASKFSTAPTAAAGGRVGWVSNKSLSKKFLEEVSKLEIKEISSPISVENYMSLFIVNEIREIKGKNNENELKKKILDKKKQDKLNLFSRSHFSNLENIIPVDFL